MGIKFEVMDAKQCPRPGHSNRYSDLRKQIIDMPVGKALRVSGFSSKKEAQLYQTSINGGGDAAWIAARDGGAWKARTRLQVGVDGEGYVLWVEKLEREAA